MYIFEHVISQGLQFCNCILISLPNEIFKKDQIILCFQRITKPMLKFVICVSESCVLSIIKTTIETVIVAKLL